MERLEDMRLFVEVVHAGSFSGAARRVGLSPASVSRHINALEDALGVHLFERSNQRAELTEVGRVFFARAEEILASVQELGEVVSSYRANPMGALNIHTRPGLVSRTLAAAVPAFLEAYPEIQVNFWTSDQYVHNPAQLIQHNVDVAVWLGRPPDSSLAIRKLVETPPRVLFATPGYLAGRPPIKRPEDLPRHNCLTWFDREFDARPPVWRFRGPDGVQELPVSGTLKSNNIEILRTAALSGLGIALLPEWAVAEEEGAGRIVRLLSHLQITPTTFDPGIYAVYQKVRHIPRRIRVFVDFMRKHLVES